MRLGALSASLRFGFEKLRCGNDAPLVFSLLLYGMG
jgi:hypothetical protein